MKYTNNLSLILITLLLICTSRLNGANNKGFDIQFKTNKFYSQYLFAQSLANAIGTSPTVKMVFEESDFAKNRAIEEAIGKIEQINLFYEYEFEGYPDHRFNGIQLWQLLKIAASNSVDVNDFSSRVVGMLPMNDLLSLVESLNTLATVHEQLIWNPNVKKLTKYIEKLQTEADKGNFQKNFAKAAKFYQSTWDNRLPFKVYVLPIPIFQGGAYELATPEGNILTYSINPRKNRDEAKDLGVIFHELCHILWQNQSMVIQTEQEALLLKHTSIYKVLGYQVLDEALATALGQGWYYKQLRGELDEEEWYAVEQIDEVSKTIYRLVETYVEGGKALDDEFVNQYLHLYEKNFAEGLFEVHSNMSNVNLLMEESLADPNILFPHFFENFSMRSIQDYNPIDEQNFNDWQNGLGTKMVITALGSPSYAYLASKLDWLPKIKKPENRIFTNIVNGEQYYILVVNDLEQVGDAFKVLRKNGKIKDSLEQIDLSKATPKEKGN